MYRIPQQPKPQPPRPFGLGDLIASIVGLFGIKPCEPCKKRQAQLNRAVPFRRGPR